MCWVVAYLSLVCFFVFCFFFFQAEDGIRDYKVTGFQTCALPIYCHGLQRVPAGLNENASRIIESGILREIGSAGPGEFPATDSPRRASALSADGQRGNPDGLPPGAAALAGRDPRSRGHSARDRPRQLGTVGEEEGHARGLPLRPGNARRVGRRKRLP